MSAPTTRPPARSASAPANGAAKAKSEAGQPKRVAPQQLTGAQAVVRSLEELGVDVVFGIPGGAVLPVYDPLFDSQKLRHVLVRHEQGAGHAASGYAHATGKVGVMMATSGPGATNLITPLADAQMDSIPVVAITGQVGRSLIGTDAFQEADITGMTMPITKHNFLVRDGDDIARVMAEAFHIARSGRPGAVLVDVPKDILQGQCTFSWPPQMDLPGYKPNTKPHSRQVREAAKLIAAARKPVLYVGGGVIRGEASAELLELAELTGIPVVTTLMARGAFPDSHTQHLGMPGMHGTVAAVGALQKSDLLIALGTRFDDRVTGQLASFAPEAKVIHADIDPAEIGKNRHADVPIVGDVKAVLTDLIEVLRRDGTTSATLQLDSWWEYLSGLKATYPLSYGPQSDGSLSPEYVIEKLGQIAGPEAVYVAGVGQHQMWAAQFVKYENPKTWLNSGGLGTMGFAVPAAMGAKFARPEAEVWAIDGDGCFQMTNQELATCAIEGAPIKVALINNGNLGMVRQWQTLFYEQRYSQTDLATHSRRIPDFVKLAEALGCVGLRCERAEDVEDVINQARAINDRPVVIDFIVGADAQVWPMVAAGTSNDEIMAARDIRPLFDENDDEGHA
ncbi:acetolactate synthase large subunit [Mycolicibacterium conceptionense]|uniref:Acetolactate synthase n=1 Tax=Mycolicibacterium conceptionense TaxID=451644 RepID=A0A1A1Y5I5_9MYCO|nr:MULTISPECIES: acetolactate synthase large subunit [Mycolicibacterium]MCW1823409.1 acetolactate synthase large subunit [Mycolicibacterium senegalense]OBB11476.1 acetolactate synthase large subunit [Mycolicibacterium conceptionense]OBF07008.1 acetolactate synthase large subunit [Mycolicibacterium conceptionense]OBF26574.1 acetolactate synthase large subunit [Mycolicibacterium conceptionense]OBF31182.1 acetolactate synthase large subunit [Mycolicibacterium conceptionense]